MNPETVFYGAGQPAIDPVNMSNEEIVAQIKRLALVLRDRTAGTIADIRHKKELVDKKADDIRNRLYRARAEANAKVNEFIMAMLKEGNFTDAVKIDKSGAIRIPASVIKELGGIVETDETKRLQRMLDALVSASERYREQLKALGVGSVNIHSDHIYIRLPKSDGTAQPKEDNISDLKAQFQAWLQAQQGNSQPTAQPDNQPAPSNEETAEDVAGKL